MYPESNDLNHFKMFFCNRTRKVENRYCMTSVSPSLTLATSMEPHSPLITAPLPPVRYHLIHSNSIRSPVYLIWPAQAIRNPLLNAPPPLNPLFSAQKRQRVAGAASKTSSQRLQRHPPTSVWSIQTLHLPQ